MSEHPWFDPETGLLVDKIPPETSVNIKNYDGNLNEHGLLYTSATVKYHSDKYLIVFRGGEEHMLRNTEPFQILPDDFYCDIFKHIAENFDEFKNCLDRPLGVGCFLTNDAIMTIFIKITCLGYRKTAPAQAEIPCLIKSEH